MISRKQAVGIALSCLAVGIIGGALGFLMMELSSNQVGSQLTATSVSTVTQTGTYGRATARVVFSINATMITTTGNFTIPDIKPPMPNGTIFQITRVESSSVWFPSAPLNSCTMTIHILEYTTNHRPSFYAFPMWITFNENPCDSNGPTTYHIFHDAKVIKMGTVKQTQP